MNFAIDKGSKVIQLDFACRRPSKREKMFLLSELLVRIHLKIGQRVLQSNRKSRSLLFRVLTSEISGVKSLTDGKTMNGITV